MNLIKAIEKRIAKGRPVLPPEQARLILRRVRSFVHVILKSDKLDEESRKNYQNGRIFHIEPTDSDFEGDVVYFLRRFLYTKSDFAFDYKKEWVALADGLDMIAPRSAIAVCIRVAVLHWFGWDPLAGLNYGRHHLLRGVYPYPCFLYEVALCARYAWKTHVALQLFRFLLNRYPTTRYHGFYGLVGECYYYLEDYGRGALMV